MLKVNHSAAAGQTQAEQRKYVYPIELDTVSDVQAFNKIASACGGQLFLVGDGMKVDARSLLGTHVASMAWDHLQLEADFDCYRLFRRFIL